MVDLAAASLTEAGPVPAQSWPGAPRRAQRLGLLDRLDDVLHRARPTVFSGHVRVDGRELRELVARIRETIPADILRARTVVAEREETLRAAREQALGIVEQARERRAAMLVTDGLADEAQRAAEALVRRALATERAVLRRADGYADDVLEDLESTLRSLLFGVRRMRNLVASRAEAEDAP